MSDTICDAIVKGIAFIEANLLHEIGVVDVANAVSYSQFYFSREFTKHTKISVYDYILRRKLSESYKELFSKQYKIVDLAYRYGFQSHEVYTRAFRKMFGENPSEAVAYKPLAVYEPIDDRYLDFLSDLRVEIANTIITDCHFEVSGASAGFASGKEQSVLVLLSPDNLYDCQSILQGVFRNDGGGYLSFSFPKLRHKLRIHHTDQQSAFRYYADNFHDGGTLKSNFVLIIAGVTFTDLLFPDGEFKRQIHHASR